MRRLVGIILVAALLVGMVALISGCGTKESAEGSGVITPTGKVTVKKTGNEITITKGKTSKKWTAATVSEKELGFPVPSSAKLVEGTAISVQSGGAEKWLGATFYTADDVNATISYYKTQLSGMESFSDTSTNISGQNVGLFSVKSGNTVKSVIVRVSEAGEQGKTWIQIATTTGAGV